MKSFVKIDIENNGDYLKLLSGISKLSGIFNEGNVPFINYRAVENIFCHSFNALNLSRSDIAYDAKYQNIGIGIKTFICERDSSTEKIAEFNADSILLRQYEGKDLAIKLSEFRNDRIESANKIYDIKDSLYHIVARKENKLILFETDYNIINTSKIHSVKVKPASLSFEDDKNIYSYNRSKSTLFRKFIIPEKAYKYPIEIIEDPFQILLDLFNNSRLKLKKSTLKKGKDFIVLPLYGKQNGTKYIFEKSGLNQWNSKPRKNQLQRGFGEFYIPIPAEINHKYGDFFPSKDERFNLKIPSGEVFNAKVCQDNSKALMTNPNKAMADWLLRTVLNLKEGELATIEKLEILGIDSVIITKDNNNQYQIDIMKTDSYIDFISD